MYFFVHGRYLVSISVLIGVACANPTSKPFKPSNANATVTPFANPSSGAAGCPTNCTRVLSEYYSIYWSPITITATVTAETLLYVVNSSNNKTRTETITNTEADLSGYKKPNNTNSAGTQVTVVTTWDGSKSVTSLLAFPTPYTYYDEHYTIAGTLPTTIAGVPTCIRASDTGYRSFAGSVFTFPSHPPAPTPTPIPGAFTVSTTSDRVDPRGWTYSAVEEDLSCVLQNNLQPLFPDLGMWHCLPLLCVAPAEYHGTALYLTGTSFSTEAGAPTPSAAAAAPPPPPPSPPGPAGQAPSTPAAAPPVVPVPPPAPPASGNSPSAAPNGQPPPIAPAAPGTSPSTAPNNLPAIIAPLVPANPASTQIIPLLPAPIIINGQSISPNSASQYLISGQTLIPGGSPITLGSGSTAQTIAIAIQTSNRAAQPVLIVGSSTSLIPLQQVPPGAALAPPTPTPTPGPGPIVIGSQTITPNSASQYVVAGQTLSVGRGPITVGSGSGAQTIALTTSGSQTYLVVGTSSSLIKPSLVTPKPTGTTMGIGGFVAGGFGNGAGVGSQSSPVAFTGGAGRGYGGGNGRGLAVFEGLAGMIMICFQ